MDRLTWTVSEVAILLGISRNTAYEAVRRGELPAIRVGRRLVIPRNALDKILEQSSDRFGAGPRLRDQ
jgi:excisionase family DNA binding protein